MTTPPNSEDAGSSTETDDAAAEGGSLEQSVGVAASNALDAYTKRQLQEVTQSYTTSNARLMAAAYLGSNESFQMGIASILGQQETFKKTLKETFAAYLEPRVSFKETLSAYLEPQWPLLKESLAAASGAAGISEAVKASLASFNEPIARSMEGVIGQIVVANRPLFADFDAGLKSSLGRYLEQANSQAEARGRMVRLLDQSLPKVALGVEVGDVAGPAMRLLSAYDGWLTSHQATTWTTDAVSRATSRGFTVDGLIATDSLTTLLPETAGYTDLADLIEGEVLPPWQEARLDLAIHFEARLAAIDAKMAEFYRAACAALKREGQDGFLEEACTGLYELLVRLFRDHIAPDEKLVAFEKDNPNLKLRNAQGKFTHAGRVRFATLAHRRGSDRDLFAASVDHLIKEHAALVSKASKGRHESIGNAMSLRTMLMATESMLSQVLDLYETQLNPPQD